MPPKKKIVKQQIEWDDLKRKVDEDLTKFVNDAKDLFNRPYNEINFQDLEDIINRNLFTFSSNFINVINFEDNKVILTPKTRLMHTKHGLCSLLQDVANNIISTRKHLGFDQQITIGEDWFNAPPPPPPKNYYCARCDYFGIIGDIKNSCRCIRPKNDSKHNVHYCQLFGDLRDGIKNDCSNCKHIK